MLNVNNLTVDFGSRILFKGLNFTVKPTDKIGLAGRNGAGKSTLLKIIAGQQDASSGHVSSSNDYTIGYLPQELQITSEETIFDEAKTALSHLERLEQRQQEITHAITTRTDYESDSYMELIEQLNKVNDQLQYYDGQNADKKIEEVLKGLGFADEDLQQPVKNFSGGWQMRVELAKLLLQSPDLLLLDEPTNHLDIESILWLEEFLNNHGGAIMMVSHDKQFLDAITNRTIEIINQGIEDYKAPYTKFLQLRKERIEKLEQAKKNQDREIAQMERNIERFRAKANKAKFAQSLIKQLEKVDRIEIDNYDKKDMNLHFETSRRSGKEVVIAKSVSKSYGNNEVIRDLDLKIFRGEKIAFVGKNGMGKSTLAKMIVGKLQHEGSLELGYNVDLGYYAQHQNTTLDEGLTLLETIENAAPKQMQGKERSLLGAFLFSGEEVEKRVSVLSGGEKARLALAKMLLEPINFLVLDEPTNHLDLQSKDVLKEAIRDFNGTLVIVSHDRDFLKGLTEKVYEFTDHGIQEHLGDVQDFLRIRGARNFREFEQDKNENKTEQTTEQSQSDYDERRKMQKELKRLENRFGKLEKQIMAGEEELEQINEQLKQPEFYQEKAGDTAFFEEYEQKKQRIADLFEEYEKVSAQIHDLKDKIY